MTGRRVHVTGVGAFVFPGMKTTTLALATLATLLSGCFAETMDGIHDEELASSSGDESGEDPTGTVGMSTGAATGAMPTTTATTDATTADSDSADASTAAMDEGSSGAGDSESEDGGSSEETGSETAAETCMPLPVDAHTVALWHLDDASGQIAADASGNGRDLQLGADAAVDAAEPQWSEGRFDGGLAFTNAESDYATRDAGGNAFADNQLTVEFWVRTSSSGYAQVFTAGFINCFVAVVDNGAGVEFGVGDGNNWSIMRGEQPTGTLNDGAWHYVAASFDGFMMRTYVDGLETGSEAAKVVLDAPADYKLGGRPANTFLEGDMDEVRLSDVARTSDEITAAYAGCE